MVAMTVANRKAATRVHLAACEAATGNRRPRRSCRQDERLEPAQNVVWALARAVAAKDDNTGEHLRRLAAYALLVGRRLGLSGRALEALRDGAMLHDIGKIGVDESILRKPGPLTEAEYNQIRQHPLIGERIVQPLRLATLIAPIVRSHHERWDGRGYPDGLSGTAIDLGARIVAVIDAFDAMTARRSYGQPLAIDAAIACLRAGAGAQWDPTVVEVLVGGLAEIVGGCERAVGGDGVSWSTAGERLEGWLQAAI